MKLTTNPTELAFQCLDAAKVMQVAKRVLLALNLNQETYMWEVSHERLREILAELSE